MTDYIKELYNRETIRSHGPLDFDDIPDCYKARKAYEACLAELPENIRDRLGGTVLNLLEECNQACFIRGFQLGLQFSSWAWLPPSALR